MIWNWLFGKRSRLMRTAVKPKWTAWIANNLWHWHVLDEAQRKRLLGLVHIFVLEKNFEGCNGLKVTDEVRVTIAAAACMLLVGFDDTYCFDRVRSVLVYPKAAVQRKLARSEGFVQSDVLVSGLASPTGAIVLSWRDVLNDCRDDQSCNNVVLHEFAHHVDGIDGFMEGIPPLPTEELRRQWTDLAKKELSQLRLAEQLGQPTILDTYGAQNLTELFAVATEAFYCDGGRLFQYHPEMYQLLELLYRVPSREWFQSSEA